MDIKDLDFKELLQKPVEEPFFAHHFQGQLSNQELETVLGGSQSRFKAGTTILGEGDLGIIDELCFPFDLPPYCICLY